MENREQEDLLREILKIEHLVRYNPCGMKGLALKTVKEFVSLFVGKYCIGSGSKDQVASYFERDVRTITRWQQQYPDFPKPRHDGHREVGYNWEEILTWRFNHLELFKDK